MAQAAKHLRKNKDLEAQLEKEEKEKEEERLRKRSRSRDKKRKVLGPFTGGGQAGVGWLEGGVARRIEATLLLFLSCYIRGCLGTHGNPVLSVFPLCVRWNTCMSCAYRQEMVEHTACCPTPDCFIDCPVSAVSVCFLPSSIALSSHYNMNYSFTRTVSLPGSATDPHSFRFSFLLSEEL